MPLGRYIGTFSLRELSKSNTGFAIEIHYHSLYAKVDDPLSVKFYQYAIAAIEHGLLLYFIYCQLLYTLGSNQLTEL